MLDKLANRIADHLIKDGASANDKEIIVYGIECTLNEIISNIIVFAIAFIMGKPLEMLIWQLFWLPLRVNIGGHHANSHIVCLIYSTLLAVGCVLLLPFIQDYPWILISEIAVTFVVSFLFAPFIHPNRQSSKAHTARIRRNGKIIAMIEIALIIVFYFTLPIWVSQIAGLGMSAAAILFIIGKAEHHINQNIKK